MEVDHSSGTILSSQAINVVTAPNTMLLSPPSSNDSMNINSVSPVSSHKLDNNTKTQGNMSLNDSPRDRLYNIKGHRQTRWDQPLPQCGSTTVTQSSTVYCGRWTMRRNLARSDVSIEPLTNGSYHARLNMCQDEKHDHNTGTEENEIGLCELNDTRFSDDHSSNMNTEESFSDTINCKNIRNHKHQKNCMDTTITTNSNTDKEAEDTYSKFYCGVKFKTPCIGLQMAMRGDRIKLRKYMLHENNIGHQLLVKQGWQAGQGLGKSLQGRVDPVPITVKEEIVGFGKMQMELERAEQTTEKRRPLECEKENTAELLQKYKENVERECARKKSLADMKASFYCSLCDKQYSKHTEYDNHMDSYDHAHKQRLKELRQKEIGWKLRSKRRREEKQMKREMLRINEYAQRRINQSSRGTSSVSGGKEPSSVQTDIHQLAQPHPGSVFTSQSHSRGPIYKLQTRDPTCESPEDITCETSVSLLNVSVDRSSDTLQGNNDEHSEESSHSISSDIEKDMTSGSPGNYINKDNHDTHEIGKVSAPQTVPSDMANMQTIPLSQAGQLSSQSFQVPRDRRQNNSPLHQLQHPSYHDQSEFEGYETKDSDQLTSSVQSYDQTKTQQWPSEMIKMTSSNPKICYSCNPLYIDDNLLPKHVDTLQDDPLTKVSHKIKTNHSHVKEKKKKCKRCKSGTGVGSKEKQKDAWIKKTSQTKSDIIKDNVQTKFSVVNRNDEMMKVPGQKRSTIRDKDVFSLLHPDSDNTHPDPCTTEYEQHHSSQHSSSSSDSHYRQHTSDSYTSDYSNQSISSFSCDSDYKHYYRSSRSNRQSHPKKSRYSHRSRHSSQSRSRLRSDKRYHHKCHHTDVHDKINVSPASTSSESVIQDDPVKEYAPDQTFADDKQTDIKVSELECLQSSSFQAKTAYPLPTSEEPLKNFGHTLVYQKLSGLPNEATYPEGQNQKFILLKKQPKKRTVLHEPSFLKQCSPSPNSNTSPCPTLISPHTISFPPQPGKLNIRMCTQTYSPLMAPINMKTVRHAPGIPHPVHCTPMTSFLPRPQYEQQVDATLMDQHQHLISNGSLLHGIQHVHMAHQSIDTGLDVSQRVGLSHSMDQVYTGLTHSLNPVLTSLVHPVHSAIPGMIQPRPMLKPQMVLTSALPILTIIPSCHQVGVVQ